MVVVLFMFMFDVMLMWAVARSDGHVFVAPDLLAHNALLPT